MKGQLRPGSESNTSHAGLMATYDPSDTRALVGGYALGAKKLRVVRFQQGGLPVFAQDRFLDFAAVYRNFFRSFDAQFDLVASDIHDRDHDVIADDDALVSLSRQNQHRTLLGEAAHGLGTTFIPIHWNPNAGNPLYTAIAGFGVPSQQP